MVLGARRNVGRQVFAAPDDYMYLPVNPSGVMAIIFASSLLMFPSTVLSFMGQRGQNPGQAVYDWLATLPGGIGAAVASLGKQHWVQDTGSVIVVEFANMFSYYHWEHSLIYFMLILFFAFFYASIVLPVRDMAET